MMATEQTGNLPAEVCVFLESLYDYLYARRADRVRKLIGIEFPHISEKYYNHSFWPSLDEVITFYESKHKEHQLILILYQELFYRHAFSHVSDKVSWDLRLGSWHNYCLICQFLLDSECSEEDESSLSLPNEWLWDIFDEFASEFLSTQNKKWALLVSIQNKQASVRPDEESEALVQLWNTKSVLNYLYSFVEKTKIREHFAANPTAATSNAEMPNLRLQIGFYASITLLKLNVAMMDYAHGLECVDFIPSLPCSNSKALLHLQYHRAFAMIMQRRFVDAARVCSTALSGSRLPSRRSDAMSDRLQLLTLLLTSISPLVKMEDFVVARVRDNFKLDLHKLQNGVEAPEALSEVFLKCAPIFASPAVWDQTVPAARHQAFELCERQAQVFIEAVNRHRTAESLLTLAQLYSNVSFIKLGQLTEQITKTSTAEEIESVQEKLRSDFMALKDISPNVQFIIRDDSVFVQKLEAPTDDMFKKQTMWLNTHYFSPAFSDMYLLQEIIRRVRSITPGRVAAVTETAP